MELKRYANSIKSLVQITAEKMHAREPLTLDDVNLPNKPESTILMTAKYTVIQQNDLRFAWVITQR